jgi:UDP-N-acetyl-D-glucosamine dehydrogenase
VGIAYKPNVGDMRESPSAEIMASLQALGGQVEYSDPMVPVFPKMRRHQFARSSVELTPQSLSAFDCVVIATDHEAFDYALIQAHAQLIVDTRGRYREPADNVRRA